MHNLLTGASGFVGQNLRPFLIKFEHDVKPLSLRGSWQEELSTECIAVIHLAGKAHDTKNTSAPEEYFRINTELTKQLFDLFLQSDARDFIYFSSVKAVADTVEGSLDENIVPNPQTPYGRSKWEAEKYLNNQLLPPGKRVFILRPCMIHGPGNKGNLNLLYKVVRKGIPWPLAAFENHRSFLSIENLKYIIKRILEDSTISGGTYNLADDDKLSTNELISLIGQAQGKSPSIWKLPRGLVKSIAKVGDALRLPLNSERLKKLTESYEVDNSKIKSVLGIEKLPVSTRDGLLDTLRSFR